MHLYEEYDLVEHLWEDLPEASLSHLTTTDQEPLPLDENAVGEIFVMIGRLIGRLIRNLIKWATRIVVLGFTAVEQLIILLITCIIQGISTMAYLARDGLAAFSILTEDAQDTPKDQKEQLEILLSNFTFEQCASKNPKLQASIQKLYTEGDYTEGDPAKAKDALTQAELWIQRNSKFLAKVLSKTTPEKFEASEPALTRQLVNTAKKELGLVSKEDLKTNF
jgi:hypothetical protein